MGLWTDPEANVLGNDCVSQGEGVSRVGDRTPGATSQRRANSHFGRSSLDFYRYWPINRKSALSRTLRATRAIRASWETRSKNFARSRAPAPLEPRLM